MKVIDDKYQLNETIKNGEYCSIYTSSGLEDNESYIVKLFSSNSISTERLQVAIEALAALRESGCSSDAHWFCAGESYIVFKNDNKIKLSWYLDDVQLNVHQKIELYLALCTALEEIHSVGILHLNIDPSNILLCPVTNRVSFIDFENSRQVKKVHDYSYVMQWKIDQFYRSPEHESGKGLSVQSDLFSMGVLLFKLFSEDRHDAASIALNAIPRDCPQLIWDIFLKLTNPVPGCRYSSIFSLRRDVEQITDFFRTFGRMPELVLDSVSQGELVLDLPLIGKASQLRFLHEKYRNISRCQTIILEGEVGVGKSKLFNDFCHQLNDQNILVKIELTHDSLSRPYECITKILNELVSQIEASDDFFASQTRDILRWSLNSDTSANISSSISLKLAKFCDKNPANTNVIPAVSKLVDELEIIRTSFSGRNLIIFVDNVHFIDAQSLAVICGLNQVLRDTLLIGEGNGNYEQNENFSQWFRSRILENKVSVCKLEKINDVVLYDALKEFFSPSELSINELAKVLCQVTGGKTGAITKLLETHYRLGKITCSPVSGRWHWSLESLKENKGDSLDPGNPHSIFELLSECARSVMVIATIVGHEVSSSELMGVSPTLLGVEEALEELVALRAIKFGNSGYSLDNKSLGFVCLSNLANHMIESIKLSVIGYYLDQGRVNPLYSRKVVDLLNQEWESHYLKPMRKTFTVISLSELNYKVGESFLSEKNWNEALCYFEKAYTLSSKEWDTRYDFLQGLLRYVLQCSCCLGLEKKIDEVCELFEKHARSKADIGLAYNDKISFLRAQNRCEEAVKLGLNVLSQLGFYVPETNIARISLYVFFMEKRVSLKLRKFTSKEFIELPEATDENIKIILRLTVNIGIACFQSHSFLIPYITLKALLLSLRHGISPETAHHLAGFSIIRNTLHRDVAGAQKYAEYAQDLIDHYDFEYGRIGHVMFRYGIVQPWFRPPGEGDRSLLDGYHKAVRGGEYELAGYISSAYFGMRMLKGANFADIQTEIEYVLPRLEAMGHDSPIDVHRLVLQTIKILQTSDDDQANCDALFDIDQINKNYGSSQTVLFEAYMLRLVIAFSKKQFSIAKTLYYRGILPSIRGASGLPYNPIFHLYGFVAMLQESVWRSFLNPLTWYLVYSMWRWSDKAPSNFSHRLLFMLAEIASNFPGMRNRALLLYEKSLSKARQYGHTHEEAVITERVAHYCLNRPNHRRKATKYLKAAIACYRSFSFELKVTQLEKLLYSLDFAGNGVEFSEKEINERVRGEREFGIGAYYMGDVSFDASLKTLVERIAQIVPYKRLYVAKYSDQKWKVIASHDSIKPAELVQVCIDSVEFPELRESLLNKSISSEEMVYQGVDHDNKIGNCNIVVLPMKINELISALYIHLPSTFELTKKLISVLQLEAKRASNILSYYHLLDEKKEIQHELKSLREQSNILNHELRTPLNGIIGSVSLMKESLNSKVCGHEELMRFVTMLENSANDLQRINQNTLDWQMMVKGKLSYVEDCVDIRECISTCLGVLRSTFEEKGVALIEGGYQGVPEFVSADAVRIRQLVYNLLHNALKFTDAGSVSLSVKGFVDGDKVQLMLCVSDTGCGVARNTLQSLLNENVVNSASGREGLGYGLSIVKAVASHYGGQAVLTSEVGNGTRVYVTMNLPLASRAALNSLENEISVPNLESKSVLIIDDTVSNCEILKGMLQKTKAHIDVCYSGAEAITFIRNRQYHLILMDIRMKPIDGFETIRRIRKIPNFKFTPILASSASVFDKELLEETTFCGFLSKPFSRQALFNEVKKAIVVETHISKEPSSVVVPFNIKGANMEVLRQRLRFDKESVLIGARAFSRDYEDAQRDLFDLSKTSNWAGLLEYVHPLQGQAANIGATDLAYIAGEIEQSILSNGSVNSASIDALMQEMQSALEVSREILNMFGQELLKSEDIALGDENSILRSVVADRMDRSSSVDDLMRSLEERSLSRSLLHLSKIRINPDNNKYAAELAVLQKKITDGQFGEAITLLRVLEMQDEGGEYPESIGH